MSDSSLQNLSRVKDDIRLFKVDLKNAENVQKIIHEIKPDKVFHLAALPAIGDSFRNPSETIVNNATIQINLLESIRLEDLFETRVLVVSSADTYGIVAPENLPIDEDTPFVPNNPYAVSKITQDFLGLQYFLSYGLKIIRVRPFNHIGPRQSPNFVVPDFAKKIAEIEKNKTAPALSTGNLTAKRDFTDVRDIVQAYSAILMSGKIGDVYNIGSGVSYKISEILDKLLSLSKVKIKVQTDSSLTRPSDSAELLCDNRKIRKMIDWEPTTPIETTLKDTLDYWRAIV